MWSESKLAKLNVLARIVTLIVLGVSLAILKSNTEPHWANNRKIASYKYMLFCLLLGIAFTMIQIPISVYYALKLKHLVNESKFIKANFYGDKIVLCVLATGVGAAFGVTADFKTWYTKYAIASSYFNMVYISAGFLFIGFVSSGVSSALTTKHVDVED